MNKEVKKDKSKPTSSPKNKQAPRFLIMNNHVFTTPISKLFNDYKETKIDNPRMSFF